MENNKKGMFTGFSKVFRFTAAQSAKGKGFKASTIILGLFIAVIFACINIIMAFTQLDDETVTDDIGNIVEDGTNVSIDIYFANSTNFNDDYIEAVADIENFSGSTFSKVEDDNIWTAVNNTESYLNGNKNAIVMEFTEDEENLVVNFYVPSYSEVNDDELDTLGVFFESYVEFVNINQVVSLDEYQMMLYNSNIQSQSLEAGETADSIGVILTKILVPMIFSLILYMMILVYGQNITKIVVAEKSSKLMETMLTSVKPYAIISGKILAVSGMALLQMLFWLIFGIAGYIAGEHIAESINPDYINYLSMIIDIIKESSDAFSAVAFILSLIFVAMGFLAYSVLAGLVAAFVDKIEDLSSAMALFQVPVIIGFLGSYFIQMSESKILRKIITYFPITSPFSAPADLMVGNINIIEGMISLLIIMVTSFILIIFTGKVYKGKLFNRH